MKEFKKTKTFSSLAFSLAIFFSSLTVAILLIACGLQMYISFRTQQKLIAYQQQLLSNQAAGAVRNFIQEKFILLTKVAETIPLLSFENQKTLVGSLMSEPAFRQVVLLDAGKIEVIKTSRISELAPSCLTERRKVEIFSEARKMKNYVSLVCLDEKTSEPMIVIGVPIIDKFGNFQGALGAEVNLKFMWDLVSELKIGEKGVAYVVNEIGDLIAFRDIIRVLKKEDLTYLPQVKEFVLCNKSIHEGEINISKGILGNLVIATHSHVGMPDWGVIVELPLWEAYKPVINGLIFSVIIFVFCIILTSFLTIFFSKRIIKPIIILRNAALEMRRGKLGIKVEIKSENEIGELASAFNEMAAQLKEYTMELEKKVEERTRELEEAKTSLEIRVQARTRELRELTESLEQQVKARTKELEEKVMELEKFRKLAVGRELKMIELKEEINRLKEELEKYKSQSKTYNKQA